MGADPLRNASNKLDPNNWTNLSLEDAVFESPASKCAFLSQSIGLINLQVDIMRYCPQATEGVSQLFVTKHGLKSLTLAPLCLKPDNDVGRKILKYIDCVSSAYVAHYTPPIGATFSVTFRAALRSKVSNQA